MKLTNAEKVRRRLRAKVKVFARLKVEYAGGINEKITCPECGWSIVQPVGGAEDCSPALAQKLIAYRGSGGGIWAKCDGCTAQRRDERYPKGWGPLGPQKS